MRRRRFMATIAVGAATLPSWVRRAFADASLTRDGVSTTMTATEALERARERRRPFVAIVVPDDDAGKRARGELVGEFLMNASDEHLAPLASCELAAVSVEELRRSGALPAGRRLPLALRIEPSGGQIVAVEAEAAPERVPPKRAMGDERGAEQAIDARVAFVAAQLATLTGAGDAALVRRRALAAAALLGADERARLDGAGDARAIEALPLGLVERGAPLLQARALEAAPPVRAAIARALGRSVAARVRGGRVPGSHWARASGCGLDEVEGMPEPPGEVIAMDCGMGHVPPRAQRFLYFYAQTPSQRWRARTK